MSNILKGLNKVQSLNENKEQDFGPEFQEKVKRLGQMANQGPRKTVWDPVKRVYKTVPVNLPKKEEDVAEGLSWSALDEGLSVEDKMTIFEEYMTSGNLTESLDNDKKDYFISLFKMSSDPVKNKQYIVVPLSIVGNRIMQLDKPAIMEFLGQSKDGLMFNSRGGKKTYPSKTMRDLSVFNTFTFQSQSAYDKFRTALSLKFDINLPSVNSDQQGVAEDEQVDENLRKWFKEKWVRFGPDGKIRGACARGDDSEGKPKCLPQAKAHALGKKGRKYAASKKRREDPNPERSGKAINVATKKKSNEGVAEGSDAEAYKQKLLSSLPQMMRFYEKNVKGWKPSEEQMLAAVETGYTVMKHTGDVKQAGKAVMDELNTLHRMSQGQQGVAEGVNDYLWHGSREEHDVLYPRQANDTGGKEESNKNAVYATPNAKVAIAMGLTTPGSDTGMFPNDPQMVLFKGNIRKGQMVYLHKVPKDLFIKHNSREWYSKPGVEEVKPIEVVKVPVDKYLNLIRQATPQDLELRKKYMKQGVAEGSEIKIPTEDGIGWQDIRLLAGEGKLTQKTIKQAIDIIRRQRKERSVSEEQLDEKCWDTHKQVGMKSKGDKMVPNCVPKESIEEAQQCPECGGPMFSDLILAEKKDACYHKVRSRYKVWPSAYASGALVQCRKKGASNWGNKSKNESAIMKGIKND